LKLTRQTREKIEKEVYEHLKAKYPDIILQAEEITYEIMGYATIRIFWETENEEDLET